MKRYMSAILSVAMLIAALSGCTGGSSSEASTPNTTAPEAGDKVLRLSYVADISTLDANLCYNSTSAEVIGNSVASLFKHNKDGTLKNELCKEYTLSEDGLTYVFKLRDDFKWSNGDPVTAHDFVYSWRRLGNPDTGSTFGNYLGKAYIVNGKEIAKGEKKPEELGVKAIDDYTLEVNLIRPVPYFTTFICEQVFYPVNQKYQESVGEKYGTTHTNMIYSGAYTVSSWETEYEIVLEKNQNYPLKDDVKIDKVVIKVIKDVNTGVNLFESNELDALILTGEQAFEYKDDPRAVSIPTLNMNFLVINEQNPILANVNARKAISAVLDKSFITEEIYQNGSTVADYIIPYGLGVDSKGKDFRDYTDIPKATDIEKGKQYWEQAKKELNLPGYTIRLMTGDSTRGKRVSEFFQSQLEKNLDGLKVEFQYVTGKQGIDNEISGNFDTTFSTWAPDYQDVSFFVDMFESTFYANTGRFNNEEYDELLKKANNEYATDMEKRWECLRRAEEILIVEQMGAIPIFQSGELHLVQPRLKGYYTSATSPDKFFANFDIVE